MDDKLKALFTPFNIGKVTVKNRFIMGPMGTATLQSADSSLDPRIVQYFAERAKGGFGLLTVGMQLTDTKVDNYNPLVSRSPLYNPVGFRRSAERLIERCDSYNAKVFAQIALGGGRVSRGSAASSELPSYYEPEKLTKALTKDEIKFKVNEMIRAAALMKSTGFHGVELHALHWGYLLDQFAMAYTNYRDDEYGGDLDNRLRITREIVEGIHQECGADYPISVRLSVKTYMKGFREATYTGEEDVGRSLEEGVEICKKLEEMGVAAISADTGTYDSFYYACPPSYLERGYALDLYKQCKEMVEIPVMAGSRMGDPYICAEALEAGQADAFVLSRPSLADPDFPKKVALGHPEKVRPCIACATCTGRVMEKGFLPACAVNPRAFRETEYPAKKPFEKKNIMIVGGGVAGMEAARMGAAMGHNVTLYEKSDRLGGELYAAGNRPLKTEVAELCDWYKSEISDLGVPVHLNSDVTVSMIREHKPDAVILAVGASPVMPRSIEGIQHHKCVSSIDAMTNAKPVGDRVVVVGGGEIGCEVGLHFIMQGKRVEMVEALPELMSVEFVPKQHKAMIRDMFLHYHTPIHTGSKLLAVNDDGALIEGPDGTKRTLYADTVILSIGMRSNPSLAPELIGEGIEVFEIGSGHKVSNIYSAVHSAFEVIYNM